MAHILESLRKHNKSDLIDIVKMHLSFQIEVTTEEWDKIIAYIEAEEENQNNHHHSHGHDSKGKKGTKPNHSEKTKYFTSASLTSSTESYKVNSKFCPPKEKELASNIFGNPLTPESLRQAMILVDFLNEDDNYKLEGIFRKSGTHERQQDLRYMLNNGVRVDLKANRFTPVDTSCILKEFIQKLPEPLLTNNHFELHFELAKTISLETKSHELDAKNEKRLKIIQLLLHLIPELNRKFFFSLMALLNRVAQARDITKMDERSLATIFGQHLICPRSWTPKLIQKNIEFITDAVEFLLINYNKLASGPKELVDDAKIKLMKYLAPSNKSSSTTTATDNGNGSGSYNKLGGDSSFKKSTENNNFKLPTSKNLSSVDQLDSEEEEGDENNTVITFCERKDTNETITEQALAELYAQVQAMPETPQKRKLIKQFNKQNGFGTPMHVTKQQTSGTSSKWKSLIPPILRPKH